MGMEMVMGDSIDNKQHSQMDPAEAMPETQIQRLNSIRELFFPPFPDKQAAIDGAKRYG